MRARARKSWATVVAAIVAAATMITISPLPTAVTPTRADSRPADPADPATPPTVTADALPTVQIDGVVWNQLVVGNTVFVGGRFSNARPAGAAPGTNLTPRSNFLAYDIRTGELITTTTPSFNAQVRSIAVSPDGSRLYVGGDFTSVDGIRRDRLAAFELPSMRLVGTFLPPVGYHVYALAVSPNNATLYVGGNFNAVGSQVRNKLAAFRTSDGALLSWAPNAQGGLVATMVVSPDGGRLVVGGKFTSMNGSANPGYGMASLDAVSGASLPWAVNGLIRNGQDNSAISSLVSDGTNVYGTGFSQASAGIGNLEGVFSATWNGGVLNWVADCHGDSYAAHVQGDAVYVVSHAHFCGNIGGFPQTGGDNNALWTYHRALAFSRAATGTVARNTTGNYFDYGGQRAPSPLLWYPDIDQGSFTGQNQGPWHVTGNAAYTVIGGEFENVNFRPQQGLVRFAVPAAAPNREGPRLFGAGMGAVAHVHLRRQRPRVVRGELGSRQRAAHLPDRAQRHVGRHRDRPLVVLPTADAHVPRHAAPRPGPPPRIEWSRSIRSATRRPRTRSRSRSRPTGRRSPYTDAVLATAGLANYWRLGETAGTFADVVGNRPLTLSGAATRGAAAVLANDVDRAVTFSGGRASTSGTATVPQSFSIEAWVRTNTTRGGKIIGAENIPGFLQSATTDRQLWMGNDGRVSFGVYTSATQVVTSPAPLNDNRAHHVVGTIADGTMRLYVDGVEVGSRTGLAAQRSYAGVWRVGGGTLAGWAPRPASDNLAGTVDEAAVYSVALAPDVVRRHWDVGATGTPPNTPPVAAFTPTVLNLGLTVDGRGSSDVDGTITSWAWNFGDGGTATGPTAARTYAAAGTYTVTLTVTDDDGATATTTRSITVAAPPPGPQAFARDSFERTVANGFGTADLGGAWTINGTPADFAVGGGAARLALSRPAASGSATVAGSATDTEVRFSVGTDKAVTGGSFFTAAIGRRVGTDEYRAKVRVQTTGAVDITLVRTANGAETSLGAVALPGLTLAAGERLQIRFQVTGTNPTTLRMKVWKVGAAEPDAWQLTVTDATPALQSGGGAGLWAYLSSAATNAPVRSSSTTSGRAAPSDPTVEFGRATSGGRVGRRSPRRRRLPCRDSWEHAVPPPSLPVGPAQGRARISAVVARLLGTSAALGVIVALGFQGFTEAMHHTQHWVWHTLAGEEPSSLVTIAIATVGGAALGVTLLLAPVARWPASGRAPRSALAHGAVAVAGGPRVARRRVRRPGGRRVARARRCRDPGGGRRVGARRRVGAPAGEDGDARPGVGAGRPARLDVRQPARRRRAAPRGRPGRRGAHDGVARPAVVDRGGDGRAHPAGVRLVGGRRTCRWRRSSSARSTWCGRCSSAWQPVAPGC